MAQNQQASFSCDKDQELKIQLVIITSHKTDVTASSCHKVQLSE